MPVQFLKIGVTGALFGPKISPENICENPLFICGYL